MAQEKYFAVGGALLGALVEEGLEEVFPGLGELAYQGEIGGAIAGLVGSEFAEEEAREAMKSFVIYTYRQINKGEAAENISEEELEAFSKNFSEIPEERKKEILNNFKSIDPYSYQLLADFLKELETPKA